MASMIIATLLLEKSIQVFEKILIFKHVAKIHAAVSFCKPHNSVPHRDAWPAGKQHKFSCPVHDLQDELRQVLKGGKDNPSTKS